MKRSIILIIFINLIAFTHNSIGGADLTSKLVNEIEEVRITDKTIMVTAKPSYKINMEEEAYFYRILYENSVEANDRIIKTMQWAIGLIVTFILLLLGSQVFFNYRISKEEIRTIKSDLEERFVTLMSTINENINETSNKNMEDLRQINQRSESDLKNNIKLQLEDKEKLYESIVESYNKDNDLLKMKLEYKIDNINIEINKLEGHVWRLRGVDSNALSRFISVAESEIERNYEEKYALKDIIVTLKLVKKISVDDYDNLTKLLPKISKENKVIKDEIWTLYKDLQKFKFIDDPDNPGTAILENV
ncbi:MAG: hypothetical protein IIA06_01920 [Proteobacteria bacterium]|nr:hypothetical protein [Pseudomonadota bacterium]